MFNNLTATLSTNFGKLYEGDCCIFLKELPSESVDLIFADPPFNLGKEYSSKINDLLNEEDYIEWCKNWIFECTRILKKGGSLFLYNLPKWNILLGEFLKTQGLTFRNWISIEMSYSLPIPNRLYPAHYSLLYYCKGPKPKVFHPDRLPLKCCRNCGKEMKDYGGYKQKMNPNGVNLTDVWLDIPPVRHIKYKNREANQLSVKLLDRIIQMSSDPGEIVLDPFGGSGTTYAVAELLERKWIGIELDCSSILERFNDLGVDKKQLEEIHLENNTLFTAKDLTKRIKRDLEPSNFQTKDIYERFLSLGIIKKYDIF